MKFSEFRKKVSVQFRVDNNRYIIAKLREVPKFSDEIFAIIKDKKEVTVIAKEGTNLKPILEEKFFRLITFDNTLSFDLSGFLSHISTLLANEKISIFAISAYSNDHVLIKEKDLSNAKQALKRDGIEMI